MSQAEATAPAILMAEIHQLVESIQELRDKRKSLTYIEYSHEDWNADWVALVNPLFSKVAFLKYFKSYGDSHYKHTGGKLLPVSAELSVRVPHLIEVLDPGMKAWPEYQVEETPPGIMVEEFIGWINILHSCEPSTAAEYYAALDEVLQKGGKLK